MCGLAGFLDLTRRTAADPSVLHKMMDAIAHRGPDDTGVFVEGPLAIGFQRLSIVDIDGGSQPFFSEDGSIVVFCNGEILNHRELRAALVRRGHRFRSRCDVEVLVHLYEERGIACLHELNGQFAAAIHDGRTGVLFLARDHCGIAPLHYAEFGGTLMFASEIKAILEHPLACRRVDLQGLDQVFTFPGLVSPRTMFEGVRSLPPGHYLRVQDGATRIVEYWDLDYPREAHAAGDPRHEAQCVEELRSRLAEAVSLRLQADAPVGVYLSGGLDSALIATLMKRAAPGALLRSFSIAFPDPVISEHKYQRAMAAALCSHHRELPFTWPAIVDRLWQVVFHAECPVKETYNACMLALSEASQQQGVKVILGGQGADELFAGYPGYRFDSSAAPAARPSTPAEREVRQTLWGDPMVHYEREYSGHRRTRAALYAPALRGAFPQFDCTRQPLVNPDRVKGRHAVHQRSYLDFKLRLSDHLLGDHGDRMILAHAVEGRYPFLDRAVVDSARHVPPTLNIRHFRAKHVLREVARAYVPAAIVDREKFGFRAPGSPFVLSREIPWIDELLSADRIRRDGYFDPEAVEACRRRFIEPGFRLHPHLDDDVMLIVLTFGMLKERFRLPAIGRG